jgi:predicted DNA-binding protein (MmcQ/YjbR family)
VNAALLRRRLLGYALTLPDAHLDHPWGEDAVKVGLKVFVFFGIDGLSEPGMTVKLAESQPLALAQPGVRPAAYNLGRSGWVTVRFTPDVPFAMLRDWIVESYTTIAPRTSPRVTMRRGQ